jgi:hypothetical protein
LKAWANKTADIFTRFGTIQYWQFGSPSDTDIDLAVQQLIYELPERSAVDLDSSEVDRCDLQVNSFGKLAEGQGFDLPLKSLASNPSRISPTSLSSFYAKHLERLL